MLAVNRTRSNNQADSPHQQKQVVMCMNLLSPRSLDVPHVRP